MTSNNVACDRKRPHDAACATPLSISRKPGRRTPPPGPGKTVGGPLIQPAAGSAQTVSRISSSVYPWCYSSGRREQIRPRSGERGRMVTGDGLPLPRVHRGRATPGSAGEPSRSAPSAACRGRPAADPTTAAQRCGRRSRGSWPRSPRARYRHNAEDGEPRRRETRGPQYEVCAWRPPSTSTAMRLVKGSAGMAFKLDCTYTSHCFKGYRAIMK